MVEAGRVRVGDATFARSRFDRVRVGLGDGLDTLTLRGRRKLDVRADGDRVRARLEATPDITQVFASPDAAVYAPAATAASPARPPPPPAGLTIGTTPLTPIGIAVTVLLIAVLIAREILRIRLPVASHARLVPLTRAAYVLLVAWGAVVLERFLHLSDLRG